MRRLILALLLAMLALPVAAGSATDTVVKHLQAQGFQNIEVRRTWLGRVRIKAENERLEREIILNPATGEILRDYWEDLEGTPPGSGIVNPTKGGGAPSSGDDDDPDRDNDDDGDDGDDHGDNGDGDGDSDGDGDGDGDD